MGTKNMLDYLKNCIPSSHPNQTAVIGTDTESSSSNSSTSIVARKVCDMKTLDSFVK